MDVAVSALLPQVLVPANQGVRVPHMGGAHLLALEVHHIHRLNALLRAELPGQMVAPDGLPLGVVHRAVHAHLHRHMALAVLLGRVLGKQPEALHPVAPHVLGALGQGQLAAVLADVIGTQGARHLEGHVLLPLVEDLHHLLPHGHRRVLVVAVDDLAVRVARPHRAGVVGGVAAEPVVEGVVGGARLARHGLA